MRDESLTDRLIALLGEGDFLRLVEGYAGTRFYIGPADRNRVEKRISATAVKKLLTTFGVGAFRVPLAREFRARHYRAAGATNAEIARRLGITETGVDKLFGRMPDRPRKGEDARQLKLFQK